MIIEREGEVCTEGRRDLGPISGSSVLLLLSFRKFVSIQV